MERQEFESYMQKYADQIEAIRQSAHKLHQSVNQTYGDQLPYGFHLDMVVQGIRDFGHLVCVREADVLPLFFGGYYHDSIEDARLTYNDVMKVARGYLTEEQAFLATEIAYALTNDKGRTRAERAGEKYYKGIRLTPYAPFVKLCDRLANISYSCSGVDSNNLRMKEVYKAEICTYLARKTGAHLLLMKANDYGSHAQQNINRIITHIKAVEEKSGTPISYEVIEAYKNSFKLYKEAVERQTETAHQLLILTASREYGLDDILFGPPERHAIQRSQVPVMLINPRSDLFSLCD